MCHQREEGVGKAEEGVTQKHHDIIQQIGNKGTSTHPAATGRAPHHSKWWREQKLSLFFVFLCRNQYENFCRWHFALVLFFRVASTVLFYQQNLYQIETRKGTPAHVIENTSFVKIKVDTCVARELSYLALPLAG